MSAPLLATLVVYQVVEVAFLALHDYVPMGRLTNLAAVQATDTPGKRLFDTAWSTLPYAFGLAASCWFLRSGFWPGWLVTYLRVSYAVLLGGALLSWWVPYFFGATEEKKARFRERFEGTSAFLPERNGIRPDTLHVVFHASVVVLLVLLWRA